MSIVWPCPWPVGFPNPWYRPELEFDQDQHIYRYRDDVCISVTQLIHRYCRPFDQESAAERVARREDRPKGEVLNEWALQKAEAASYGTAVHQSIESIFNFPRHPGWPRICGWPLQYVPKSVERFFTLYPDLLRTGWPEVQVVHPRFRLAGTVDLLCDWEGQTAILDWKTNQNLRWIGFNNMLPPVDHLDDCALTHYTLQLSCYARILRECYQYDADRLAVVWLGRGDQFRVEEIEELSSEVDAILHHYGDNHE